MSTLWQQRYRDPNAAAPAVDNPVIDHLLAHRSVRQYLNTPLPAGTLETLLAAAQSASTSSNLQAWSLLAIEDPAHKARLPQSVVLHREHYQVAAEEPARLAAYEAVAGAFSREKGQNTPPWSEQVLNRLKSIDALHGRERIADTLRAQRLALR